MLIRSGFFIILTVNFIQGDPIFPNATSLNRFRRQTSSCRINEFKCKNGECISEDMLCDGLEQCSDGSDETTDCRAISCAPFLFRCSYGACINEDLVCDGRKDCKDNSDETAPKCKGIKPVINSCGANKFQCTNGECIDDLDICDGVASCKDGSDETQVACGSIPCPGFAFRCAYGGCVNNDARCNGVIECQDGSDENGCPTGTGTGGTVTTSTTRRTPISPPDSNSCVLPEQIKNGIYQTGGDLQNMQPGDFVASSSSITFKCKPGFKFDQYEATTIYCITGKWHTNFPICKQFCEPLVAANMQVTCMDSGFSRVDCNYAFSGTRATIKCNPLYENQQSDPNRFCRDGSWNSAPPVCTPVCGQKSINAQELAVNAQATVKGEYPWQAIIYHNRIQICGGTVISPKLTITAAHCFKNQGGKYEVAAGKYFREYLDDGDKNAQYSDIKIAKIPSDYQAGVQNYQFDIAVLVLDQPFKLTEFVQPVCVDWESRFEREQLVENSYGVVSGWGYTKSGEAPSEELKKITVPYIPRDQCLKKLPEDNDRLVTSDKFCAGYTNGTSVCQGDSGGGLIFRRPSDRRYYLRGIVSIAPRLVETGSCDPNTYALYTLVSKHLDYVTSVRGEHGD